MQDQPLRAAFIGLGVMGYPMAGHLARAGHDTVVFNRTASKADAWVEEYGGKCAGTPRRAAAGADVVFTCVGNDDDVRDVILGDDGVLAGLAEGSIVVDHTTASATIARELHATAHEHGIGFLDAPVSGGQAGAENGQLTVMVGGDADVFARARPVIDCYAKAVTRIGPTGAGQLAKMVNQICIAGIVQGLSEGLHFAEHAGLDPALVIESISRGAAQSWQMENRWETMVAREFDFGFAVDWMRKDLGLTLDEAARNGARLDITALVDRFYAEVQAMGGNRWDTSSLIARYQKV
ncbi:MAG: NAD(P)-dependent oxidoreductase [Woeseiaceae bacterium]|jgi:2-hydroxy-3-oxopropionate reductase